MCKIEFLCIWLTCCCVEGLFETGGLAKKSATSGVEGGLGSGEKCISKRSSIWEGAIMLGDGVEQGGNKHALAETGQPIRHTRAYRGSRRPTSENWSQHPGSV